MLSLTGCSGYLDPRCYQNHYYCLGGDEAGRYLRRISDRQLIELAVLDYRTSMPPSGHVVHEMARRGPSRARAIFYEYARASIDERLIDEMVRTFSDLSDVCGDWRTKAPTEAGTNVQAACGRVFGTSDGPAQKGR